MFSSINYYKIFDYIHQSGKNLPVIDSILASLAVFSCRHTG